MIHNPLKHPSLDPYRSLIVDSPVPKGSELRVTFLGVSTVHITDGTHSIMSDGFFSRPNKFDLLVKKFGPIPERIDQALSRAHITKLDAVLVAHSHHDHALDSAQVAQQTGALLIGSSSVQNIARSSGFCDNDFQVVYGKETFSFGRFKVTVIKSLHSPGPKFPGPITEPFNLPARICKYRDGKNFSYLVEHEEARILIHGSANFIRDFMKDQRADIVFLSIARVAEQDEEFAKQYWREVVKATKARIVIPIHWDDFTIPLDVPLVPMPKLIGDFDKSMNTILELASDNNNPVAIRLLPAFQTVGLSDLRTSSRPQVAHHNAAINAKPTSNR